jgi:putative heme-binding domain-containing protein
MGEHGPHAVVHGPDDKVYLVIGNHAHLYVDKLAANSPLTRWPNGQQTPDQGMPGSKEDVLLKRQNDANGHAAGLRAPGGTIWRMDLDGKNPAQIAGGFRNHFDAAFNPEGELFTFDSDMEWDENLPWYRPVRVCHVIPGAEFGWRTGSSKIPPYYEDTLPAVYNTGRGSPTGVTFYDHYAFPKKYRGAFFMCDWSIGVLWAVHLQHEGAGYKAQAEKFCTGSPMPISDVVVGQDGAIYFTVGGRGTQGGVFRIVATDPGKRPDNVPPSRADVIRKLGYEPSKDAEKELLSALRDTDPLVRRLACESLIRLGIEPPVSELRPLFESEDRFLRTAARLVLQRIDPKKWAAAWIDDANDRIANQAIIALCKIDKTSYYIPAIFARLSKENSQRTPEQLLEWLRTVQLAIIHAPATSQMKQTIADRCLKMFPHADALVSRELAVLLAEFARDGVLRTGVIPKLLAALTDPKNDRAQQIHYYYCLRVIKTGWTASEKAQLLAWYDGTKTWTGGASYTRYLENILREMNDIFTAQDRAAAISQVEKYPLPAMLMLKTATKDQLPTVKELGELFAKVRKVPALPKANELKEAIVEALSVQGGPDAERELRGIADADVSQRAAVGKALLKNATQENLPYVVHALTAGNAGTLIDAVNGLLKSSGKPKPEDGASFRSLLMASTKIDEKNRWKVVQLLRHWTSNKQFGAKEGDWKAELASWSRWFNQSYPMLQPVPDLASVAASASKYKYDDLLAFLTREAQGKKGDPLKGKLAFTKAQCIKCHRFGNEGEGLGPDLSAVSKRFKRSEILESMIYPSKVISDQYRSTKVTLLDGKTYLGLLAPQAGSVTILLQDGTKVVFKESDIEERIASLISVMPEKLLDELTKEEIADLFAFLETEPKK